MKIGLSTYSLNGAFKDGRLDMPGIVRTIAEWGGEHVEVVPLADFIANPEMPKQVKAEADKCGIPLSSYTFDANFLRSRKDGHDLIICPMRRNMHESPETWPSGRRRSPT